MNIKTYQGRSNVSSAIALSAPYLIVADDEDNKLSVFDHLTQNPADPEELNIEATFFFPNAGSRYFCRKIFSSFPAGKNRQKSRDRLCLRHPDSSASPRFDPTRGSKHWLSHDLTP
ncbi:hypothetical protein [Methylomonas fluvii]|uniref:Uncharacterized protein n=1 Tax=Methylomonas fluvii TaxID=1854564 RepID=A0ABR9DI53_9GAMM|nr:hypothetical protein [Methylomonas fluvii]MBD9361973.1 hypothetical protein [Methylomonas fluvii]CAD6875004.1 hypothetical protein [Methylomonas fluvii]